ncbi:hypothetical protein G7Z17_g10825 [Cylindrodendrum hubeiense]|uniref:alpha-galactosidase n=1 Tax=Cylindrodendrum hubeiense TaxID=595255 RepID=A0A9P5H0S7_9HYPO|nr:hypothetical protein G7Z17_g10825 [Cylindrodendrum hubeiense]
MPSRNSWLSWKALAIIGLGMATASPLALDPDNVTTGKSRYRSVSNSVRATTKWKPSVGDTWQIVLQAPIKIKKTMSPDVQIWSLDMYDNSAATFKALHDAGKKVVCYFSAGSWEDWRDDAGQFNEADLGKVMDGWPNERWLDTRTANVRNIMKKRIAYAAKKGCDAIDADNVDGYGNDTGKKLSKANSIDYVKFLAQTAASYKMSMGMKNGADIVSKVVGLVDFAVVEQCVEYEECDSYQPYIKAGKPVFLIEYPPSPDDMSTEAVEETCPPSVKGSSTYGFTTVIKNLNLDGYVRYCGQTQTYTTSTQRK